MQMCHAPIIYANLKLTRSASYFTSLMEALNLSCNAYSIFKHFGSGELKTRPTLNLLPFKKPSTYKSYVEAEGVTTRDSVATQLGLGDTSPFSSKVSSAMKSTMTWPLTATFRR